MCPRRRACPPRQRRQVRRSLHPSCRSENCRANGARAGGYGAACGKAEENERYALHIHGDSADGSTSGKADKLKSLIASDPEKVSEFFSKFSQNMYTGLYSLMGTSSLSSVYKVYNDKQLKAENAEWTTKITELESKLSDMEDKYYKKFSVMESTLAKINSKGSSVSSFFGQ